MTRLALALLVLFASSSLAHIKLTAPPSWQNTNALGDPQKVGPCGEAGTPSNIVTTVQAGSQLTVAWTDTIFHPGHYRISIAENRAGLVTPTAVVMNNDCKSAPIEMNPVLPTIVDGLFPHTTGSSGMMRSTTITVPMMSCDNCTLQLLQFMSAHAPPCFYFQCANLRIVLPEAGQPVPDAGVPDAGPPTDAGAGEDDAGVTPAEDGGHGHEHDAGVTADAGTDLGTTGGCGCATPADVSGVGLGLALLAARARRRRR